MRSLSDLMGSAGSRSFLEAHGMLTEEDAFLERLEPPADDRLNLMLGRDAASPLVYVGQQACCDYRRSVKSKFLAARDLGGRDQQWTGILWHDMDRAGSDELAMRILLPLGDDRTSIRLAPRSLREREPRFIGIARSDLEELLRRIGAWIGQGLPKERRGAARSKLAELGEMLLGDRIETLAQANRAIASALLRNHLSFEAPSAFVSEVATRHLMSEPINDCLASIDDFIAAVNEGIERLLAENIDPQVRPLPPDYLPLRYSCPRDGSRIRLTRELQGGDQFAVGTCGCGTEYRFHLGGRAASLGELESTDRWSLDIALPAYLNDLASGFVAGRSSAVYGLILNGALTRAMGRRPIPAFVPPDPPDSDHGHEGEGNLLYEYLAESPNHGVDP